jgi:hypothetical protein
MTEGEKAGLMELGLTAARVRMIEALFARDYGVWLGSQNRVRIKQRLEPFDPPASLPWAEVAKMTGISDIEESPAISRPLKSQPRFTRLLRRKPVQAEYRPQQFQKVRAR